MRPGFSRRKFMLAAAVLAAAAVPAPAFAASDAQAVADQLSLVRSMSGRFVQFAHDGSQSEGSFVLARPGKVSFRYDGQQGLHVVADGKSVVIHNRRLGTADLYPLNRTPLATLLADRIDLKGRQPTLSRTAGALVLGVTDRSVSGNGSLEITLDPATLSLRQWVATDAKGRKTTVVVYEAVEGVAVDQKEFAIDYARIGREGRARNSR